MYQPKYEIAKKPQLAINFQDKTPFEKELDQKA